MPSRSPKTAPPENASSDSTILEKIKEFGENVLEAVTKPFRHTPARKSTRRKAPAKKATATGKKPAAKKAAPAKKTAPAKKAVPAKKTAAAKKSAPAKKAAAKRKTGR